MNPLIHLKETTSVFLAAFGLACFALPQTVQAVSPAPDGGYPNKNTAEGQNALFSLDTSTTGGHDNTAMGFNALFHNTTGSDNTAVGWRALFNNVNPFMTFPINGNTAVGSQALYHNTTGSWNTAVGLQALFYLNGFDPLGDYNTAVGAQALYNSGQAYNETAIGAFALHSDTDGEFNTAAGATALYHNTMGMGNAAIGSGALYHNTTGNDNTALGVEAGYHLTTGNNNIDIGYNVLGIAGESNTIRIGNTDITTAIIRGISGATVASGAAVFVASNGQLGTVTSSQRFKQDIKPMNRASEAILALKPVTFRYKKEIDPQGIPEFGLVAEEVAKVNPGLIIRDAEGKPYTVRYEQINAMLLNEFLKEHKKVEEQEATITQLKTTATEQEARATKQEAAIAQQQRQIEALSAGVQKVSAQLATASPSRGGLEVSKPAPKLVARER